jgi:hypothetical protein
VFLISRLPSVTTMGNEPCGPAFAHLLLSEGRGSLWHGELAFQPEAEPVRQCLIQWPQYIGPTAQDFVDAGVQLDRIADERREVGSWSTPSPLSRSLAPLADLFGQLAYVTFVHEPLLQSTGVP